MQTRDHVVESLYKARPSTKAHSMCCAPDFPLPVRIKHKLMHALRSGCYRGAGEHLKHVLTQMQNYPQPMVM